jgi:hypothetical protein
VRIYRHASLANDIGIHLQLESVADGIDGSRAGFRLAAELLQYGMVEHSNWIE